MTQNSTAKNEIAFVTVADSNYVQFAISMIRRLSSMDEHKEAAYFVVFDEGDGDVPAMANEVSDIHWVTSQSEMNESLRRVDYERLTFATWIKLFLPVMKVFESFKYLVYLDTDSVCNFRHHDLYRELGDSCIRAVDIGASRGSHLPRKSLLSQYYSASFLIFNLQAMKKVSLGDKIVDVLINDWEIAQKMHRHDQDFLNLYFQDFISPLDLTWCAMPGDYVHSSFPKRPRIVHYAGRGKPWSSLFQPPIFWTLRWWSSYLRYNRISTGASIVQLILRLRPNTRLLLFYYLPAAWKRRIKHFKYRVWR